MESIIPDSIPQKKCTGACKQWYPATTDYFHRNKAKKDGLNEECKTCKNARSRRYDQRSDIREKRLPRQKAWNDTHKKYLKEYHHIWNQTHKESESERQKRYYQEHKEHHNAMGRMRYWNNREYYRAIGNASAHRNREKRKQQRQMYYYSHKEVIAERHKRYHQTERGKQVARSALKRYRQKESTKIKTQQYYQAHRDSIIARHIAYHRTEQGRKVVSEAMRRYNQTEHGKSMNRIHAHRRRARKKSIPGTYTLAQVQELLIRQRHCCYYCTNKLQRVRKDDRWKYIYHVDHTFPLARVAGSGIPANDINYLVLTCPTCNLKKGDKFPWEWPEGGRLL